MAEELTDTKHMPEDAATSAAAKAERATEPKADAEAAAKPMAKAERATEPKAETEVAAKPTAEPEGATGDAQNASFSQAMTRRKRLLYALLSAVAVAIAFQGLTMARNNYKLWRMDYTAIEVAVALVSALVASRIGGLEERGEALAARYTDRREGILYRSLRALPATLVSALIMSACLSVVNAIVAPIYIYRGEVEAPINAIIIRFLADIPQAVVICLAVRVFLSDRVTLWAAKTLAQQAKRVAQEAESFKGV